MGTKSKLDGLDEHFEASLKHFNVPGAAVSVVKDGEVVLAKGYGYKDFTNKAPMTENTVLPIGSATKSFTAMAACILADEGKLCLDAPVRKYLPGFEMHDPAATQYITLRDMLCHRGGMPRHDLMWAVTTSTSFTREDLVARIRYLEPNAGFREKSQYQNHMIAAVGHVVEKVSGTTWEDFVKEKILSPLGMDSSNFSCADSQKMADFGLPHKWDKQKNIIVTDFMELGPSGPAGSINSTASDMAKWMLLVLSNGSIGEIVSEEKMKEMLTPHMHYSELPWEFEEIAFSSLGLGWFMDVYRGTKIVHHGGNVLGATAMCALLPKENLGITILANLGSTFVTYAIRNEVFDRALGVTGGNWDVRYKDEFDKLYAKMEEGKAKASESRKEGTKPTHDPAAYEGRYENPGYGAVIVKKGADGGFELDFNGKKLAMEHYHYNQFSIELADFETELPAVFGVSVKGDIDTLTIPFEMETGKQTVFTKKADKTPSEA